MLDPASLLSCEAIIKYYSRVIVEVTWHDVEWLKIHLNHETSIEWRVKRVPETIHRLDAWTDLRITSLRLEVNDRSYSVWKEVLPRLHYLTTLQVKDVDGDMGDLYEIVTNSSQITEFKALEIGIYQLDKRDLVNLIAWFRRQPVRVFEAEVLNWGYLDNDLRQTLCEAMFNCPTLDSLRIIEDSYFEGIDFTKFTFLMQRLRLLSQMTSDTVRSFSYQLEHSNLNFLELADYDDENVEGAQLLLQVLPCTSIKHLNFIALQMTPENWCKLAPPFENCGLESLLLVTEGFSSDFIHALAAAMHKNHTISELYLSTHSIDLPTLDVFIQSFRNRADKCLQNERSN
ncbi:hypothetical protein LEN26_019367 [Aphanomyces euteiches]|nr:hypothetical protein LEN26_019367 [Aphanomyces euteiches]